jgi:hypothetical protein
MNSSQLGYTKEQVVNFWTAKLATKISDQTNFWEGQISISRAKIKTKFNELEELRIKKSIPTDEITSLEDEIKNIKEYITSMYAKIEKIKADCDLHLKNINENWDTTSLVQAGNFAGNPIYFFMPYGADANLDFDKVNVTYLGKPFKPVLISEDVVKASGISITQQLIISTGGVITVYS